MSFAGIVEALQSSSVALAGSGYITRSRRSVDASGSVSDVGVGSRTGLGGCVDAASYCAKAAEIHKAAVGEAKRIITKSRDGGESGSGFDGSDVTYVGTVRSMFADGAGRVLEEPELVLVRPGRLEIWSIRSTSPFDSDNPSEHGGHPFGGVETMRSKLIQVAEYPLWGDVQSLSILSGSECSGPNKRDAIVLCSRQLKISVIAYSEVHHELRPTSLHNFEHHPAVQALSAVHFQRAPMVRCDPDGRCCVVIMNDNLMATMEVGLKAADQLHSNSVAKTPIQKKQSQIASNGAMNTNGNIEDISKGRAMYRGSNEVGKPYFTSASPLVTSSYVKSLMVEHEIMEVLDCCFLNGYSEPVVLVLYINSPSWAGNLHKPMNRNSCCLKALSLNISRKHHPCIWSRDQLPHDCYKLISVPGPIGGAIVVSPNILLHVSQMRAVIVPLNSYADEYVSISTVAGSAPMTNAPVMAARGAVAGEQHTAGDGNASFKLYSCMSEIENESFVKSKRYSPVDGESSVRIESGLRNLHCSWIAPECCAILSDSGQLFLLALQFDGRAVHGIALTERGTAVIPSTVCGLGPFRMFIGSMVGDSLLLRYGQRPLEEDNDTSQAVGNGEDVSTNKKRRVESEGPVGPVGADNGDVTKPDDDDDDDDDMNFLYKSEVVTPKDNIQTKSTAQLSPKEEIALKVEDSLVGTGVLRDLTYGEITVAGDDGKADTGLVCCAGEGRYGSLNIMRSSIVPELVAEIPIQNVVEVWTVVHDDGLNNRGGDNSYHSFLIIGLKEKTMILESKEALDEIGGKEGVDFITNEATISASSVCSNNCIVQVTPTRIRFLAGKSLIEESDIVSLISKQSKVSLEVDTKNFDVLAADILGNFVCLSLQNGCVILLEAKESTLQFKTVAIFDEDVSDVPKKGNSNRVKTCKIMKDDDKLFLGSWLGKKEKSQGYYLVICDARGILRFYSVPEMKIEFESHESLGMGFPCYYSADSKISNVLENISTTGVPTIHDMHFLFDESDGLPPKLIISYGDGTVRLYDFKRMQTEKEVSEADVDELYENSQNDVENEGAPILYYSQTSNMSVGTIASSSGEEAIDLSLEDDDDEDSQVDEDTAVEEEDEEPKLRFMIYPFSRIGGNPGLSGVFISGSHPRWFVLSRGKLLLHSSLPVGSITTFAPFHNVNCQHGFVISTTSGSLRLCQLPANVDMAGSWPVQRIVLGGTPISIAWHAESHLYGLAVIYQDRAQKRLDEDVATHPEASAATLWTQEIVKDSLSDDVEDQCEIQFLAPGTWNRLYRFQLEPSEVCSFMKILNPMNTTTNQREWLIAVGTITNLGEDSPVHGRLFLFGVEQTAVVSGAIQSCRVSIRFEREFRASVTAIAGLDENIILSTSDRTVGTKLMVQSWDGKDLTSIAFFDAPMYIVSLSVLKNFIMFLDVQKGCHFVQWKPNGRVLSLLGKDFIPSESTSCEFLIDEPYMSLVGSDSMGNIQSLSYAPGNVESWKGQKLLSNGQLHIGRTGTKCIRLKIPIPSAGSSRADRHAIMMTTLEGSIMVVIPLEEMTFRRLTALQERLNHVVPSCAGLNASHHFRPVFFTGCTVKQTPGSNLLNAETISRFMALSLVKQNEVADHIGSSRGQILANLAVLQSCVSHL